ncbi:uncharacterized protein BDZ99DRAFT_525540 [Mytilinidion resinicola]|uniref:Uncharacterized protein n=1 Tax=Mytilinidion resinicola TaxID=574789 RepID=A0A6A6Y7B7_9PEZI|nr:uncharacterized protein BDZ99DRAFT_525540 [Mytilinidion resinicola]KAF2804716.1 hypothetical protein BDZ99DRAFT_525540 [Mytilinidion resinicola]
MAATTSTPSRRAKHPLQTIPSLTILSNPSTPNHRAKHSHQSFTSTTMSSNPSTTKHRARLLQDEISPTIKPSAPSTTTHQSTPLHPAIPSTTKSSAAPTPNHRTEFLGDIRRNWTTSHLSRILPPHLTPTTPTTTWRAPLLSQNDISHIALLYRIDHGAYSTPFNPIPVLKYTLHADGVVVRNPTNRPPPPGWASAVLDVTADEILVERLERGDERRELGPEEWSGSFVRALSELSEKTRGRKEDAWAVLQQALVERKGKEVRTGDVRRAVDLVGGWEGKGWEGKK